jgi:hypothetical protein
MMSPAGCGSSWSRDRDLVDVSALVSGLLVVVGVGGIGLPAAGIRHLAGRPVLVATMPGSGCCPAPRLSRPC